MSPRYVQSVDQVVATCQGIRDGAQRSMSRERPSFTEVELWSSIEVLADCIELLAGMVTPKGLTMLKVRDR